MENFSFQGQPHQEQATRSQPLANCSVCNEIPTVESTSCHKCHKIFHLKCINIDNNQQNFICIDCTNEIRPTDSPKSFNNSTSLSLRNKILALRRLEERQLAKERDTAFLKQKYQLLQEAEGETEDHNSVDLSSVHEWLNNQPNPSHLSETNQTSLLPRNNNPETNQSIANNIVTFTAPMSIQSHVATQSANNHITIDHTHTNSLNKLLHSSLSSTLYNNTTTFINKTFLQQPPTTTTAAQHNSFLEAPASYTFRPSHSSIPHSSLTSNLTQQQVNARHSVPKDLPVFTGNPAEWPLFISTYTWSTTICGFTDAENLIRLQKTLKGDALKAVQHILIHPSCVHAAISTLK